jgi:hypothetical protein
MSSDPTTGSNLTLAQACLEDRGLESCRGCARTGAPAQHVEEGEDVLPRHLVTLNSRRPQADLPRIWPEGALQNSVQSGSSFYA